MVNHHIRSHIHSHIRSHIHVMYVTAYVTVYVNAYVIVYLDISVYDLSTVKIAKPLQCVPTDQCYLLFS